MKKHFLPLTYVVLILSAFFSSCSSDDSTNDDQDTFIVDGKLIIESVSATTIKVSYDGINRNKLNYGIRKVGEEIFVEKSVNTDGTSISELIPAQTYEVTLLVKGDPDFKSEIKKVTTQPFSSFEDQSTKVRPRGELFYSEIGFNHQLKTDVFNETATLNFFFVNKDDESDKKAITHVYTNGNLGFETPKDWGSEPYEELRYYYLCYQVDGGEIKKIVSPEFPEKNITFVVYNPEPHISEVKSIEKIDNCSGNTYYKLDFKGFFMNTLDVEFFNQRYFKNSTAFITRDDDNSEFILNQENAGCRKYNRIVLKEEVYLDPEDTFGMYRLHTSKHITIQQIESVTPDFKFTTGDYKIRIVFSNDAGDFYDTNTFSFTIP